jgi:hypothetical protein
MIKTLWGMLMLVGLMHGSHPWEWMDLLHEEAFLSLLHPLHKLIDKSSGEYQGRS